MATFCLTTSVKSGEGVIVQPGCEGKAHGPNEDFVSCANNFDSGTTINLMATPSTGWSVSDWDSSVPGIFTTNTIGQNNVVITMPSSDVSVQVIFIHGDVNLVLQVGSGNGCIILESPLMAIDCGGTVLSLPAGEVRVGAEPDSGWQISSWELDGSTYDGTSSYVDFTLYGYTQRTITVYFEEEGECNKNNLNISIVGKGSVSPTSGEYCDYSTLTLSPIPSPGYFFRKWEYVSQSGISVNGISLLVDMNVDRSVTAIFDPILDYEAPVTTIFYCPSSTYKDSVVSFDFTNDGEVTNPSIVDLFHFRVTFYSDYLKKKVVYSSFSMIEDKRWFYKDDHYHILNKDGIVVHYLNTVKIIYDPEILPISGYGSQKEFFVNPLSNIKETPLVCGVQYYVSIEVYSPNNERMMLLKEISLILECEDVNETRWSFNKDKNNWICSGQGKDDLKVTTSHIDQSIYSDISSNIFGMFQIVWQSRRDGFDSIYGCVWDSESDFLYSSGQGIYDTLQIENGYNPVVLTDQASNFYISSNLMGEFLFRSCPFGKSLPVIVPATSINMFKKFCTPGLSDYLDSSYDQVVARIYDKDISGSIVINKDKAIPVINKKSIRLDVSGIVGAYAVRIRNIDDEDWRDWINIDNNLYYGTDEQPAEDLKYSAYRIDNSRIMIPLNINKINGVRRICLQVLTLYGITNTYCIEFLANFSIARHVFKFYYDSAYSKGFPVYDGKYVLSLKDADGNIITGFDSSIVYFEVIFSEDIYKDDINKTPYASGDIKFNIVQQGTNDVWDDTGLIAVSGDFKKFRGSFSINKDDGVFNKDGTAFINLSFPDAYQEGNCLSDTSDKYNLMIKNEDLLRYQNLSPEEIYKKSISDKAYEAININSFKQYYNKDDSDFRFGNPLYFYSKGD